MNVLVTGGTGFIGSAVVKLLNSTGHNVNSFDITKGNDIRWRDHCFDLMDGADAVIHLAGILGTDELFDNVQEAIDINIKGTANILNACANLGVKYVGVTMLTVFPSIYTATKISNQAFATAYHHAYGIPVTHVRAFNAYGPEQQHGPGHPRKIIPAFSVEGWNNIPLKIWGNGEQMVDLIHVDDVARVFLDALNAPGENEIIDAGTGVGWTVNEVADFVLDITGSTAGVEHVSMRRGEVPTKVVAEKAGNEYLSFVPKVDKIQLMKTIVSYRGHE